MISIIFLASEKPVVRAQQALCDKPFEPVATALTDLGNNIYTRMDGQVTGFTGGLYPDGSNQPPAEHAAAGLEAASRILPLDANGNPDIGAGKIGMISVGMSNTYSEFKGFIQLAKEDQEINPNISFVNGAIPGQTAQYWVDPQGQTWEELDFRLSRSKLTPQQVQVAWVKLTLTGGGIFPARTQELQADLEAIAHNLKAIFPNLQIAFFSSRTRSYTYWEGLSPEPLAFETGFAVKWMIEKQINYDPSLNFDPKRGPINAPYLAWGPYLWADGTNPRSDGLVWTVEDLVIDCTHPSNQGNEKVANQLLIFFKTNPAGSSWFLAKPEIDPTQTVHVNQPTYTSTLEPSKAPSPSLTLPLPPSQTSTIIPTEQLVHIPQVTSQSTPKISNPDPEPTMGSPFSRRSQGFPLWGIATLGGLFLIAGWIINRINQLTHKSVIKD